MLCCFRAADDKHPVSLIIEFRQGGELEGEGHTQRRHNNIGDGARYQDTPFPLFIA